MEMELLYRLGIAALLCIFIGIEREWRKKPVGLKTVLVIGITSCLLTTVSIQSAQIYAEPYRTPMDPLRLAAQIVSGVGFLGAGVILRRRNDSISGLTTAAMVWGASGIGITVGAGFYLAAAIGVALILISVDVIPWLVKIIGPSQLQEKEIRLKIVVQKDVNMTDLLKQVKRMHIKIPNVRVKDLNENEREMVFRVIVHGNKYTTDVYYDVSKIEGVSAIEIESL